MTRQLNLSEKSTFFVRDKNTPVIIRDKRGILFYSTEPMLPRVERFNLPRGNYIVDSGDFFKSDKFIAWPEPKIPTPERDTKIDPAKFSITVGSTPHKCVINWVKGKILLDKSFLEKPIPEVDFIINHEYGHRFFGRRNEHLCDLFAVIKMLRAGYNPSQTGKGQIDALSGKVKASMRKWFIVNKIKSIKNGLPKK